jgi:hypothetical protein
MLKYLGIIPEFAVTKSEIIHTALTGRTGLKRFQNNISNPL